MFLLGEDHHLVHADGSDDRAVLIFTIDLFAGIGPIEAIGIAKRNRQKIAASIGGIVTSIGYGVAGLQLFDHGDFAEQADTWFQSRIVRAQTQ